jgi:hypothetical protein
VVISQFNSAPTIPLDYRYVYDLRVYLGGCIVNFDEAFRIKTPDRFRISPRPRRIKLLVRVPQLESALDSVGFFLVEFQHYCVHFEVSFQLVQSLLRIVAFTGNSVEENAELVFICGTIK